MKSVFGNFIFLHSFRNESKQNKSLKQAISLPESLLIILIKVHANEAAGSS